MLGVATGVTDCRMAASGGLKPQRRLSCQAVFLYTFDLLQIDSRDLHRDPIEDCKAELAKLLRRAKPGLQLNEHITEPGDIVFPARLQARVGRHRVQARRLAVQVRPLA